MNILYHMASFGRYITPCIKINKSQVVCIFHITFLDITYNIITYYIFTYKIYNILQNYILHIYTLNINILQSLFELSNEALKQDNLLTFPRQNAILKKI